MIKEQLKKMLIIAKYAFVEIYKSRVMTNVLILGFALAIISYVAAEFTYGVPGKVALDFGLGLLTLSSVGISIFMGSSLISKELEGRTIYMTLSRPVMRSTFLMGRILGMLGILALNIVLLGAITLTCYMLYDGSYEALIGWSLLFSFFEAAIILLVVVIFSLVTNNIMAVIYSIAVYTVGHALSETLSLTPVLSNNLLSSLIKSYGAIFPDFSKFNVKQFVLYSQHIESEYLYSTTVYGIIYLFFLAICASLIFSKKSLD